MPSNVFAPYRHPWPFAYGPAKSPVAWTRRALFGLAVSLALPALISAQTPPVINLAVAPRQTVAIGDATSFIASVSSPSSVTYQWMHNGLPIPGATSLGLAITAASPVKDGGWYQLVAQNSSGTTKSPVIYLAVVVTSPQIVVWGETAKGQANVPAGLTGVSAISAGFEHCMALLPDGTVVAWGGNGFGQTRVPTGLANVVAIAAPNTGGLALKADGTVVAWGNVTVPPGLTDVVAIAADYTCVALKSNGTVVAWGDNSMGQTNVPAGLNSVTAIATGGTNSFAVKSDGTVVGWGSNIYGQLNMPSGLGGVTAIAASDRTFALKSDQSVVVWGTGLTLGQTRMPAGVTGVSALSARSVGNLVLMLDGTVQGWSAPAVPSGLNRVIAVALGDTHAMALRDVSGVTIPAIISQPVSHIAGPGERVVFGVTCTSGGAASVTYQWRRNGVIIPGATGANYTTGGSASEAGSYDVLVSNYLGTVTSAAAVLTVPQPPTILSQPTPVAVNLGGSVSFSVSASGYVLRYQWRKNGSSIPGATDATYTIAPVQNTDGGDYTCFVSNSAGTALTNPASLLVLPSARLANISVRTTLANAQLVIVGFVVSGAPKDTLVRAAGPALAPYGVPTALSDPRLELYQGSRKVLENDNWPEVLGTTFERVGAFAFPANSRDSALMQSLYGSYSAVVSGTGPGVVLVEGYDAGVGNFARFINISARNRVGTGADVLIAGFSVVGTGTKRVLIRGAGPTLGSAPFNLPGTLADPKLELYDATGAKIAENDNWDNSLAATFASVGAFAFVQGSKDAALTATLAAGQSYSVQLKGADGGVGEAVVEVYELP